MACVCLSVCLPSTNPRLSPASPFLPSRPSAFYPLSLSASYVPTYVGSILLLLPLFLSPGAPTPAAAAVFPVHAFFSFFFLREKRRARLVSHRPAERKDCKPPDELRIPEWGLLHSTQGGGFSRGARAPTRPECAHQQLVGEISPSSRSILIS